MVNIDQVAAAGLWNIELHIDFSPGVLQETSLVKGDLSFHDVAKGTFFTDGENGRFDCLIYRKVMDHLYVNTLA